MTVTFQIENHEDERLEVNISNIKAGVLLRALARDPEADVTGYIWELDECDRVLQKLIVVRNTGRLGDLVEPAYRDGNFYYGGISKESLIHTIEGLLLILQAARQMKKRVVLY